MTTATRITIKEAGLPDIEPLYSLIRSIYESTDMMCEQFTDKYPNLTDLAAEFDDLLSTRGSLFLVAEDSNALHGYLTIKQLKQQKLQHTAYLNMGVAQQSRGKSVGRHLLRHALAVLTAKKHIEILYLNVREDNNAAVNLYEAFGFETIARLERDTKVGDQYYTGLLMRSFIPAIS